MSAFLFEKDEDLDFFDWVQFVAVHKVCISGLHAIQLERCKIFGLLEQSSIAFGVKFSVCCGTKAA